MKLKQLEWDRSFDDYWASITEGANYYILKNEEFYELWLGYDYKKIELLDTYSSLDIAKKEAQKHLEKLIKGLIENV